MLWWLFVVLNLWWILVLADWATVPFHFIWISMALLYGWRVWGMPHTVATLVAVAITTGVALWIDVASGHQGPDELTEIPLMAAVFFSMVFYVHRAAALQRDTERVSSRNHALLEQNRRLVQNASHSLRTPLTIALGTAEVLQRTSSDPMAAEDAQVIIDELRRLKKTTDRLLQLAKSNQPDYLFLVEVSTGDLLRDVVSRWRATHPEVRMGTVVDDVIMLDRDRTVEALDELISNAAHHGDEHTAVEVSSRNEAAYHVLSVSDTGPGIPPALAPTIFDRFSRLAVDDHGGVGLGLAIVQAVTEAHGGLVRLAARQGGGSTFEILLPLRVAADVELGYDEQPVGRPAAVSREAGAAGSRAD